MAQVQARTRVLAKPAEHAQDTFPVVGVLESSQRLSGEPLAELRKRPQRSFGDCTCYGLGPYDDVEVTGPSISPSASCSGYAACMTYRDEFGDPACSCGPDDYTPPQSST